MPKKDYRNYMIGGALLGGLYLLTRNTTAQQANGKIPDHPTELVMDEDTFQNMMNDIVTIDGKMTFHFTSNYFNPQKTAYATLPNLKIVEASLSSAMNSPHNYTTGQKARMNQLKSKLDVIIPRLEVEAAEAESAEINGLSGRMMANRNTRRFARNISGMKSWSKNRDLVALERANNDAIRQSALNRMRASSTADLYAPIDTLDTPNISQSTELGSALVNTRDSMRRLL